MDETTNAIPGYAHTHGVYWDYGRGYNDNNCVENQINQLSDTVNANGIREAVNSVGNNVVSWTASVKDTVNWVNQNVTSGNYTTLTGLNDLWRDVTGTINHQTGSLMGAINSSNIATLTGFNNTNSQISEHFGQTFLQNKDLQASIERCCCDIRTEMLKQHCDVKQLVSAEANTTRALITDNRMHDLEDKLAQSRLKVSQAEQTNALIAALGSNGPGNS